MIDSEQIVRIITDRFPGKTEALTLNPPQAAVVVDAKEIVSLVQFITDDPELKMDFLSCISAVDMTEEIEIVYFFCSIEFKHKLTIKTKVDRLGGKIDTISTVLQAANWFEREIWELFGVDFNGHPNLERFLLQEDWDQGHPMLRDWEGENFERLPEK